MWYLDATHIEYNRTPNQRYDQSNCRQLYLQFLRTFDAQFEIDVMLFKFGICLNMSLTFTLARVASLWQATFQLPDLSDDDYEFGLTDFETYYSISNVNSSNNKFYFDKDDMEIIIPEGSYEGHWQISETCNS